MNLTPADVRSLVIECLRKDRPYDPSTPPFQVPYLFKEVAQLAKSRGLKTARGNNACEDLRHDGVDRHPHLKVEVWNIVWDLIVEGVIRPGGDERQMEF